MRAFLREHPDVADEIEALIRRAAAPEPQPELDVDPETGEVRTPETEVTAEAAAR